MTFGWERRTRWGLSWYYKPDDALPIHGGPAWAWVIDHLDFL